MPIEAWLSAVGPGREGSATDVRFWAVAQSLWSRIIRRLINRNVSFERALHRAANIKLVEATTATIKMITLPNGRKRRVLKRTPLYGSTMLERIMCLSSKDEGLRNAEAFAA